MSEKYKGKETVQMNEYYNWNEVPLVLSAKDVQKILGLSKGKTYELMNSEQFPTLFVNKRMLVTKEAFIAWLTKDERKIKRRAIRYA